MPHETQRAQTHDLLRKRGITRALFANAASVKWLTGFNPSLQTGPNVFLGGPPLVWYEGGAWSLVLFDGQLSNAGDFDAAPNCQIVAYEGYSIDHPPRGAAQLRQALRRVMGESVNGKIGIELRDAPADIALTLGKGARIERIAVDDWLTPFRRIKTPEELRKMRDNFRLTDIGHAAARAATKPGAREIQVWNAARAAIEQAAGQNVPMGNDCVVGYRQNNIGGAPLAYEIRAGDSVIVDLSTLAHGYWSDSCATYYAGEPSAKQRALHATLERALAFGLALLKPGAVARDIDAQMREFMRRAGYTVYPHHTGHSLGVTGHEDPRLVPYNDMTLQENMVIMLEPGIYFSGETSGRLEDAALITRDGAEILTHHDKTLP